MARFMDTLWPSYPRDASGDIPEPQCFDFLTIRAEHGGAYLWDMNGACITVGCVTGDDRDPMDALLDAWQSEYEGKPLTPTDCAHWNSERERFEFDEAGRRLAVKLYDTLNGKKTVIYEATDGTTFAARCGRPNHGSQSHEGQ